MKTAATAIAASVILALSACGGEPEAETPIAGGEGLGEREEGLVAGEGEGVVGGEAGEAGLVGGEAEVEREGEIAEPVVAE